MFRDEYKKMNETITPGSELLARTERSMEEIMNKRDAKRMSVKMVLALALACVLALTGVAFATGAIENVFVWIQSWGGYDTTDLQKLDQLADSELGTETKESERNGKVSVELNQAYYDGTQLIVGAKYKTGEWQVIHGLDHELMATTRESDPAFNATKYPLVNEDIYLDANGMIEQKSKMLPATVTKYMTDEDVKTFEEAYEKNGEAGMIVYNAFASDHIEIEGEALSDNAPDEDLIVPQGSGETWRYAAFDELDDGVRGQEKIRVIFGINQRVTVVRADKDGVWIAGQMLDKIRFPFEVENNGQETHMYYGSFENEVYSAKVELCVSEVNNRVVIDMVHPAEWSEADAEAMSIGDGEVDYIFGYCVIMPDGSWESAMQQKYPTENGCRMEGVIELAEGQTEVILRPRYNKSGLVEGEDIVLKIDQTPVSE